MDTLSTEEFLRAFRLSRAQGRVVAYVRQCFKCAACEAKGRVLELLSPASVRRRFRFNETFGVDIFEIEDPLPNKHTFLNIVCWGSLYQLVKEASDKRDFTVGELLTTSWIQYIGSPLVMIAGQGREFIGSEFQSMCDRQGLLLHITDVRAPWQNGRTERHGDLMRKHVAKKCFHHTLAGLNSWR